MAPDTLQEKTWTHQGSDSGTNSTVRSVYAKRITLVIETAELRAAVPLLRPTDEMLHGWREEKETDRANIIFDEASYATDEMDIDLKILAESSRECDRGQSAPSIVRGKTVDNGKTYARCCMQIINSTGIM
ncbi:hypothetical protein HZ326_28142 [Fusarium oxysporum f. sp. albedinis]|nr:hypothetical protein HZ326_28142 [Fusarium oxysporum f. sp. albedinis]